MSNTDLMNFFARFVADRRPLVLASVYETAGSTYSKVGARMLIAVVRSRSHTTWV